MQEQKKRKKNQFIIQLAIAVFTPIILIFIPAVFPIIIPDNVKFSLLSINMALFFLAHNFFIEIRFSDQKEILNDQKENLKNQKNEIKEVSQFVTESFQKLEYVIQSDSMYKKILQLENGKDSQYYKSLESFLLKLNECIDDQRSGELEKTVYYDTLEGVAQKMIADKNSTSKTSDYNGDIWALTFCLLKEWDENDSYEKTWFETILNVDRVGVKTRRLWIFNSNMTKLLRSPINEDSKELLQRLKMYCAKDTKFKNTDSYALSEEDISYTDINEFGKGFFAAKYSDESTELILGVAKDRIRTSKELCGEIDYNPVRRASIRGKWESYLKRAKPLICYLEKIAHQETKEFMKELNFGSCSEDKSNP